MARVLPTAGRASTEPTQEPSERPFGGLGTAVVALGLFAAAYAVGRRVWPGPEADRAGEQDGPDERGTDEASDALESDTEFVGEEPSDEAIVERGEPDVQEEPAEPGEMTVDDEVVEDIVEEDVVDDGDTGGDER